MSLSAIYFDLDGTLVDSEHLHAVSWNKVLAMFDLHFSETEFCQQFAGKPTLEAAKVLVEEHQLGLSASALAKKKHIVFAEISKLHLPALLPGAKALPSVVSCAGTKGCVSDRECKRRSAFYFDRT